MNGYYELAARTHKKGLKITLQDTTLVEYEIPHLMNLGLVKKELGNYPEARKYLNQALEKSSHLGIVFRDAQIYGNLGSVEIEDANYGKAVEHFMDALSIFEDASASSYIAKTHINLANCYLNLGELSKAENSLGISFQVVSEAQEKQDIAEFYQILGELEHLKRNYIEAEEALLLSIEVSKSINDYARMQTVLYSLVELYKVTEQNDKRLARLEELINLNSTIYEEDLEFSIIQLNREFDLDKLTYEKDKESEIAQLTLEKRNVLILLLVACVLILIVGLLWYRQVSKLKIIKQQADIDAKELTIKKEAERFELERSILEKSLNEADTLNKSLKEEIDKFQSTEDATRSVSEMEELTNKIKSSLLADKDWIAFNIYFEALYPKFSENLRAKFEGKITNYEQRLIRLIKLELTNKEMSIVLAIQRDSVVKAKIRLKEKLGLETIEQLEKFTSNI